MKIKRSQIKNLLNIITKENFTKEILEERFINIENSFMIQMLKERVEQSTSAGPLSKASNSDSGKKAATASKEIDIEEYQKKINKLLKNNAAGYTKKWDGDWHKSLQALNPDGKSGKNTKAAVSFVRKEEGIGSGGMDERFANKVNKRLDSKGLNESNIFTQSDLNSFILESIIEEGDVVDISTHSKFKDHSKVDPYSKDFEDKVQSDVEDKVSGDSKEEEVQEMEADFLAYLDTLELENVVDVFQDEEF